MPESRIGFEDFVNEAAKHIRAGARSVQVPESLQVKGVAAGAKADFCTLWPAIRKALEVLKEFLPGWAKWMVDVLIAIGEKVCGAS